MSDLFKWTVLEGNEALAEKSHKAVLGSERHAKVGIGSVFKRSRTGKMVEIPRSWTYKIGGDGEIYPVPPDHKTIRNGDGSILVAPKDARTFRDGRGMNHIITEHVVTVEGANGELSFYSFE